MSDTCWVPKPVGELVNSPIAHAALVVQRAVEKFITLFAYHPMPFPTGPHVSMNRDASFIQATLHSLDSSQDTGSTWAEANVPETVEF